MSLSFLKNVSILLLVAGFLSSDDADAARRRGRRPRYRRPVNAFQCEQYSWKPNAKTIPSGVSVEGNGREPFMTGTILAYIAELSQQRCKLMINSTYRHCEKNRQVGGAQKSRHLCGSGADTSGTCDKRTARRICQKLKLHYIEEGGGRFAHCQPDTFCDKVPRD